MRDLTLSPCDLHVAVLNPLAISFAARPEMKYALGKAQKMGSNHLYFVLKVNIIGIVYICVEMATAGRRKLSKKTLYGSLQPPL